MVWSTSSRRKTPNTVSHYGWTFELTDNHFTDEEAEKLKFQYDELAERALEHLDKLSPPQDQDLSQNPRKRSPRSGTPSNNDSPNTPPPKRDLFALLRDNADSDPALSALWTQATSIPPWVDWDQLARGQDVFYRYAAPMMTGLAYQALLGGMGFARIVSTLALTGGFSIRTARRRIFETTQHVLQVTRSLESLRPGGEGFEATLRVRLLHAAVRRRIMRLAAQKQDYYDIQRDGIPINDLDCIATIAAFGPSMIWLSLPRQGIYIRPDERADYVALWRYVAHVIGSPTECFATPDRALAALQSVYRMDLKPDERSRTLANNIVQALHHQPPSHASAGFLTASARWLIGKQLADDLGLYQQERYYDLLMLAQCVFFMLYCYTARLVPAWDRRVQRVMRRIAWRVVVEGKTGLGGEMTMFGFQYVPELGMVTEKGESWEVRSAESQVRAYERRNLTILGLVVLILAASTWAGIKLTAAMWRGIAGYM